MQYYIFPQYYLLKTIYWVWVLKNTPLRQSSSSTRELNKMITLFSWDHQFSIWKTLLIISFSLICLIYSFKNYPALIAYGFFHMLLIDHPWIKTQDEVYNYLKSIK